MTKLEKIEELKNQIANLKKEQIEFQAKVQVATAEHVIGGMHDGCMCEPCIILRNAIPESPDSAWERGCEAMLAETSRAYLDGNDPTIPPYQPPTKGEEK